MKLICVDLFCGGGGFSAGLLEAADELGIELELIAINHWPTAIATHVANHPRTRQICARVEQIQPRAIVPGGRVHLLVASPECTHFSVAAGGRPVDDQRRVPAFGIIHWLQELYVDSLIIENVPEFRSWAPLGVDGQPLKSRRGETYQAFLQSIRACGHRISERIVCCADFGDATARKRLFIIGTRIGQPTWPEETHSANPQPGLFADRLPWRGAREIIDWSLVGRSVFDRPKPLVSKTLKRVAAGMKIFNGIDIAGYLGLDPASATQAKTGHKKTTPLRAEDIQPFIIGIDHKGGNGQCVNSVGQPLTTITTKPRHALLSPFVIGAGGPERAASPRSLEKPLNTILTRKSIALVEPRIVEGQAFMVSAGGPEGKGRRPKSVEEPLPTVLTENHNALIRPFIITVNHGETAHGNTDARCHEIDRPLPTVTTNNGYGIVQAFLTKYYGTATVQSVNEPLDTVTTHERFGLVEPRITDKPRKQGRERSGAIPLIPLGDGLYLDLRFRMLKSHELAAATGFPKGYVFRGNQKDVVKQIGNAVPHFTAKALCKERLKRYCKRSKLRLENSTFPLSSERHACEQPN